MAFWPRSKAWLEEPSWGHMHLAPLRRALLRASSVLVFDCRDMQIDAFKRFRQESACVHELYDAATRHGRQGLFTQSLRAQAIRQRLALLHQAATDMSAAKKVRQHKSDV